MSEVFNAEVSISKDSIVFGHISYTGTVRISGKVNGGVNCTTLIVQKGGDVQGTVTCVSANISGSLSIKMNVDETLFIDTTGKVDGEVSYGQLDVAKGGTVSGNFFQSNKK